MNLIILSLLLLLDFKSISGQRQIRYSSSEKGRILSRATYVVASLCSEDECTPDNMKDKVLSCMNTQVSHVIEINV